MNCKRCGAIQQDNNIAPACMSCGAILESTKNGNGYNPWENTNSIGLYAAFVSTAKKVLTKPSTFFDKLNEQTNLFTALMFALLATSIGTLGDLVWQHIFSNTSFYHSLHNTDIASKTVAYSPIILIFSLTISTSYIYIITSLFKCRKYSFKTLLSAICYTQAVAVLTVIPFLGLVIMPIWSLITTLIMVSKLNRISISKTILILLLPAFILFILIIFPIMIFMGGVLFSIGTILKYYQ